MKVAVLHSNLFDLRSLQLLDSLLLVGEGQAAEQEPEVSFSLLRSKHQNRRPPKGQYERRHGDPAPGRHPSGHAQQGTGTSNHKPGEVRAAAPVPELRCAGFT